MVTVRAEMSRLRKVVGADVIASRPYRLLVPITTDIGEVYRALDVGDVIRRARPLPGTAAAAVDVTGRSGGCAPSWRRRCAARCWPPATRTGAAPLAGSPDGRDDRDGWRALHDGTRPRSVQQAQARRQLAGLDFDLG